MHFQCFEEYLYLIVLFWNWVFFFSMNRERITDVKIIETVKWSTKKKRENKGKLKRKTYLCGFDLKLSVDSCMHGSVLLVFIWLSKFQTFIGGIDMSSLKFRIRILKLWWPLHDLACSNIYYSRDIYIYIYNMDYAYCFKILFKK